METSGNDHLANRLLCSVDEVCDLLGARRTFVFSLIASGQLPSCKLGRLRKVARADVESFVAHLRAETETGALNHG